jgi:hypothetical protein
MHKLLECLNVKGKVIPIQAWTGPWSSKRLKLPEFLENQHTKVAILSAVCTGLFYSQDISLAPISI